MIKLVKTWHSDNVISSQYSVNKEGILNGECRTWNRDGNLETQCNYVDGKVVGKKTFFGLDGKVDKEVDYDFDGCPFVIRFFADERTEEWIRAIGLASGLEGLTLTKILDAFDHVRSQKDALELKLIEYTNRDNSPPSTSSTIRIPVERNPRVTFT